MARTPATVDLAFSVHGPADGVPVVLLHGFPLARQMWKAQTQVLAEAGYRVITPDLRGHGESPVPDGSSTMERCAADVVKMLDGLGVDRCVLGGFSLGGYVALEVAARHPGRLLGLALVDTRAGADTEPARRKRLDTARDVRQQGTVVVAETMLPKLLTSSTRRRNVELTERVLHMMLNTDPTGVASALMGMAERADHTARLPRLDLPTLVVVGDEDEITPPKDARAMARALPRSRFVLVKGAAHLTPLERPEAVNAAFLQWLEKDVRALALAA